MATAHMPDEFFDIVAHHLPSEQPVRPQGGRPRVICFRILHHDAI